MVNTMFKKRCLFCGEEFEVEKFRKDTAKFCSYKCKNESQKGEKPKNPKDYTIFNCINCGKKVTMMNCYYKNKKYKVCSFKCYTKVRCFVNGKVKVKCRNCGKELFKWSSRIKKNNFCSRKCSDTFHVGKNHLRYNSIEKMCIICKRKFMVPLSRFNAKYCSRQCWSLYYSKLRRNIPRLEYVGEKNPQWKGGKSRLILRARECFKYKAWTIAIFKRDNYTCQECGQKGGKLNAHHLTSFSSIFYENNIKSYYDFINCDELWDVGNGETLCQKCHGNKHRKNW